MTKLLVLPSLWLLAAGCTSSWSVQGDDSGGADTAAAVDADADGWTTAYDCVDNDPAIHPGADETCDGVDQDCDGEVDEAAVDAPFWFADADGDGHGDPTDLVAACTAPAGRAATGDDCDDADARVHPDAAEADCDDPTDYNCDGSVGWADADGDGAAACADCNDLDAARSPAALEGCNGVDDDCDGEVDEAGATGEAAWFADADGDGFGAGAALAACAAPGGYVADASDCDDTAATTFPGAPETCDALDDDCDGAVDEAPTDAPALYTDADGDGYGDALAAPACTAGAGTSFAGGDCDDGDAAVSPAAVETCNEADDDCDGLVDDRDPSVDAASQTRWTIDQDADGYGDTTGSFVRVACVAPAGFVANADDCDDDRADVSPAGTEVCDSAHTDEDCNGSADDAAADPATMVTRYLDGDGDGYGDPLGAVTACDPAGAVALDTDCDDTDADVHPGAPEQCDTVDTDCDGATFFSSDFASAVDAGVLQLNGTAAFDVANDRLVLTDGSYSVRGGAALVEEVPGGAWSASLDFRINTVASGHADGMTLYFLDTTDETSLSYSGGGSGLGVYGLPGWAVELDTFSGSYDDLSGQHVALIRTDDMSILAEEAVSSLMDADHTLDVDVLAGTLTVSLDGVVLFSTTDPAPTETLTVGVSAATGGLTEAHYVDAMTVTCD